MDWKTVLKEEKEKEYYKSIKNRLVLAKNQGDSFCPDSKHLFRALNLTPLDQVKIIILGQDPFHGLGQANGLCFAVNDNIDIPPSLRNIFKEIENEYGEQPKSRNLIGWANQGVLLLNTVLSVEIHKPLSHKDFGWQNFTDRIIIELDSHENPKVFMLWGKHAKEKKTLIHNTKHLILETTHPSPFSASYGFMGCGHFKMANEFLKNKGIKEINWINS